MLQLIFCETCQLKQEYRVEEVYMDYEVKGETFNFHGHESICESCGHQVFHMDLEKKNQAKAFDMYRELHGVIKPQEIIEIRERYGLSQRDFSLLLGFGEITIARYERGTLPTEEQNLIIKSSSNPVNMLNFVKANGRIMNPLAQEQFMLYLKQQACVGKDEEIVEPIRHLFKHTPNEMNGFKSLNWRKMKHMISYFADKQRPFVTSMCKLLFYSDFYHYLRYGKSISGTRYVRMDYGPCPEEHNILFNSVKNVTFVPSPSGRGQRIYDLGNIPMKLEFTDEEWETLEFVNEKFEQYTPKEISDYSHEELAWKETAPQAYISYEYSCKMEPVRIKR
ncbi:type II TA system antitoxin MqsA family protein [Bacillus thuringiensis]|uniref:type II TA system antitoxin MqsA family protein n=1 Tax=Bacillus thuringiensis TaxID=1428 RepID=UPI003D0AC1E0